MQANSNLNFPFFLPERSYLERMLDFTAVKINILKLPQINEETAKNIIITKIKKLKLWSVYETLIESITFGCSFPYDLRFSFTNQIPVIVKLKEPDKFGRQTYNQITLCIISNTNTTYC